MSPTIRLQDGEISLKQKLLICEIFGEYEEDQLLSRITDCYYAKLYPEIISWPQEQEEHQKAAYWTLLIGGILVYVAILVNNWKILIIFISILRNPIFFIIINRSEWF